MFHHSRLLRPLLTMGRTDSVPDIAALAKKPHSRIRKTKVGHLRRLGFDIRRHGRFPHLTLRFSDEPTDKELASLIGVFDGPEANPHPVE